jgi:uncharacterized protein YciI
MPAERHLVVIFSAGSDWDCGLPLTQQSGIQAHHDHYAPLLQGGQLAMGGPFADAAGGSMLVFKPGMDEDRLRTHALADPAVETGVLQFEIRPWVVGSDH